MHKLFLRLTNQLPTFHLRPMLFREDLSLLHLCDPVIARSPFSVNVTSILPLQRRQRVIGNNRNHLSMQQLATKRNPPPVLRLAPTSHFLLFQPRSKKSTRIKSLGHPHRNRGELWRLVANRKTDRLRLLPPLLPEHLRTLLRGRNYALDIKGTPAQ